MEIAEGKKHDNGKDRWDLTPWKAFRQCVRVLGYGGNLYGDDNWRKVPNAHRRYLAAAFRHLVAWSIGERTDKESGLPHLAHAMCCVAFLLEFEEDLESVR